MQRLKQWLKILLTELFDLNIVVFITNIILILAVIYGSNKYGDFIQFLSVIENNIQIVAVYLFILIVGIYFVIKVVLPSILKRSIGQLFFSTQYVPKNNINVINLFLLNITGPIINLLLLPVTFVKIIKNENLIGSTIAQLHLVTNNVSSYIKLTLGLLLLLTFTGINIFMYKTNIFFNVGKQLTNYEKLMDYAIEQKNPDMLSYFIKEYKHQASGTHTEYYECILSLLKGGINKPACNEALATETNKEHLLNLHKFLGTYYINQKNYDNAVKYLEYFYTNKIINNELVSYLYAYLQLDNSYNHKNTITKISKIYNEIKASNNPIVQYKIALVLLDNRQLSKAIELLQLLVKKQTPVLDKSEILWYLGEALFLNKKYKQGLDYMKQAQKLNPTQYKTLYESYLSYYKTQIAK